MQPPDEETGLKHGSGFPTVYKRCVQRVDMVEFRPPERDLPSSGGMAEWLKAPVLKTGMEKSIVGSNPSPSAYGEVPERPIGLAC